MSTILSRVKRALTPAPITVGSKWSFQSHKGDPWAEVDAEVVAVRDGWVRYVYLHDGGTLRGTTPHSCSIDQFCRVYYHLPDPSS